MFVLKSNGWFKDISPAQALHLFGVLNFTEKFIAMLVLQSFWFKLRNKSPCCLSNVHFDIEIPEDDNIQVNHEFISFDYLLCGRY